MLAEILLKPSFLERLHHWLKTVAPTEDYKLCIVIRNALSSDSAYVLILKFYLSSSFWYCKITLYCDKDIACDVVWVP
jgi:hypothetical protein